MQYPRVEQLFRGDLGTIRSFCKIAQPEHLSVLDEVERAFLTEFDYAREAKALATVASSLDRSPFRGKVAVPRPVQELCTRRVLVMEYLDGEKLVDALRRRATALAASRGLTLAQLREQWASASWGDGLGPPPSAPRPTPPWQRAALLLALRASDWAHNAPRALANATTRRLRRQPPLPLRSTPTPPLDVEGTLALLAGVHAHQIFLDGLFNGDAHPGNVLLLRDGRLGLIDYGQACTLPLKQRLQLARLICSLAAGSGAAAETVKLWRECGYTTLNSRDDLCYRSAVVAFDRDDRGVTGGLNVQAWFEAQAREDPVVCWPDMFVMVARNAMLLRGMGIVLGHPLSVAKAWRSTAAELLRREEEAEEARC